jgi:hypothetical protein
MRTLTRAFVVAPFVGVAALAVGVVPASADASGATVGSAPATSSSGAVTTALPNVSITFVAPGPAKFHPRAITVAPKAFTTCRASAAVMIIRNKTTTSQTLTYLGKTFNTIPPSAGLYICADPPAGFKAVFNLTGSTSKLTVTFS